LDAAALSSVTFSQPLRSRRTKQPYAGDATMRHSCVRAPRSLVTKVKVTKKRG